MLRGVRAKFDESQSLVDQLERQVRFFTRYGIQPHEIKSIRVRASGYPEATSWVTLHNGTVHEVQGIDVKRALDGHEAF